MLMARSTSKKSKKSVKQGGFRMPFRNTPLFVKLFVVLAVGLLGAWTLNRSFADSSSLYVSPASTTVNVGDTFTVAMRLSPVSNVDSVEATLTFDPAVLQYVSTDVSSSAFPVSVVNESTANTVHLVRGIFAPSVVSTDALIANVTFKALAASSGSPLTISGDSLYAGTRLSPGTQNGTVVVNSIAPPPPPPPSDTTAPVVTISSPKPGTVSSKVVIKATATDDSGTVNKMEVYIDGGIVSTSTTGSISYTWNNKGKHAVHGAHTILVKAYDPTGNVGSSTVSITN
jgi:hypothetical protein